MATSGTDPVGDAYAMSRSEAETERLIRQSGLYAPFTRHLFEQAGLRPGMRVLQQESKALTRVRSQIRVPAISSSSAGTACRFNGYDERCKPSRRSLAGGGPVVSERNFSCWNDA
jgi:hypothetical protein